MSHCKALTCYSVGIGILHYIEIYGEWLIFRSSLPKVFETTPVETGNRYTGQFEIRYEAAAFLSFLILIRMPGLSGLGNPIIQSRTTSTSLNLVVSNSSKSKRVMTRATVRQSSAYTRLIQLSEKESRVLGQNRNSLYSQTDPGTSSKTHEVLGLQVRIVQPSLRIEFVRIREDLGIHVM
jgi:hypothetical protein